MPLPVHDIPPFKGLPGLVWAFRFDVEGHAVPLDVAAIDAAELAAGRPGWLWLHFNQGDARTARVIEQQLDLPDSAKEALLTHDAHANLYLEDGLAHGALVDWQHGGVDNSQMSYARCEQDVGWLHFVMGERLLVTARRQGLRSVEQARRHAAAGGLYETPEQLLEAIVERFGASIAHATLELDNELDRIEDRVLGEDIGDERRELALLRRQAVHMHRPLSAQRRVLRQFEQRHRAQRQHPLVATALHLSQQFDEVDSEVGALQARARLLHEEVAAKLTEATNRHLHTLSILTALLMPPTLVVGAFGMNMDLPFAHQPHAFAVVTGLCVLSSITVYLLLRRIGVARV